MIRRLIRYIQAVEEYTLNQELLEQTIASEQKQMAAEQILQVENQKRAQNLFEFLIQYTEKSIQAMSVENLKKIFSDFEFEVSAEISKKSGVLGTMIVHAYAEGKEYLYVELHPKGGIHYSSYVLICLYDANKKVIGRHKVVMSKSSLYLGKNQEPTTTFNFLHPDADPSDLPIKEYRHASRYFAERPAGKKGSGEGTKFTPEGVSLLEREEDQLFSMRPVEMAKGKQMLGLGIWDKALYDSVHRMRDEK